MSVKLLEEEWVMKFHFGVNICFTTLKEAQS